MSHDTQNPRDILLKLFHCGIQAADPMHCVPKYLPPKPDGRTIVIAAGKAAASMARAVEMHWGKAISENFEGIAVTRYDHGVECEKIEVIEAAHPVPDNRGEIAAQKLMDRVSDLDEDDLVLCLISGGGSALLGLPAKGIAFEDKKAMNKALLASGAPIGEMNIVRKHLSAIKGGRLAKAAYPARMITLAISDVPGDDPSVIASGPTVPDASTSSEALSIIEKYGLDLPDHMRAHLQSDESETPKPGDKIFENTQIHMAARPIDMVEQVVKDAEQMGYQVISLGADIEGEAYKVGQEHAQMALDIQKKMQVGDTPVMLISGGETTVTIDKNDDIAPGRGGRNCEYLLSLAVALNGQDEIHAMACDTDGIDGSEDNAGAFVTPDTLERAKAKQLLPQHMLRYHDSYSLFEKLDDLIKTGPTRTNVNDLRIIFIQPIK